MSQSSLPSNTLARLAAFAVAFVIVSAAAACGFDGRATLETSSSGTEPQAGSRPDAPGPPGAPRDGAEDGGGDASTPVLTCSDPALSFDGVDDAATVPDDAALDIRNDFTVEAWIKPSARATTDVEMDLVSHHDAVASQGWVLLVKSGRIEIVVYGGDIGGSQAYSAGNEGSAYVVPGKWAHVAGTREGDTLRVYYDGVLRDSQTLGLTFGRNTYAGALRLGRAAATASNHYQGELDDVHIAKIARYTGNAAPKPASALPIDGSTVAAWRFDEPSGNVLIDAAKLNHDGSVAPDPTAAARVPATCIASR